MSQTTTTTPASLDICVIYSHPADYPQDVVVRRWSVSTNGSLPRELLGRAATLEEARKLVPAGGYRIPPQPGEDAAIVEVWV